MTRLVLFMHWDKNNIVEDYVVTYIQGLQEIATDIVFVSNCELSVSEQQKVKEFTSDIFIRENLGMDFGAWKYAFNKLETNRIQSYDEVVFANDSCLAPMFPFSEMFQKMVRKPCDFWGVTRHKAGQTGSGIVPNHLQSYFLVFKKNVVNSTAFVSFLNQINDQSTSYDDVIYNAESQFTVQLLDAGFTQAVYLDYPDIYTAKELRRFENPRFSNTTIWSWSRLLQARSPFLKRKAIPFHLSRTLKLAKIGYGFRVTKVAFRQTFYWYRCLIRSGSAYDMTIVQDIVQRDNAQSGGAGSFSRGQRIVLFYLYLPYRIFKIVRHALRDTKKK